MNPTDQEPAAMEPAAGMLAGLVVDLAIARSEYEIAKVQVDEAEEAVKATDEGYRYFRAQELLKQARAGRDEADAKLRDRAISLLDGGESPHPAITVKNYNVLDYNDADALVEAMRRGWLHTLNLNKHAFEKNVKAVLNAIEALDKALDDYPKDIAQVSDVLRFRCMIHRRIEPRVTIATNLDEWLPEPDVSVPPPSSSSDTNTESQEVPEIPF